MQNSALDYKPYEPYIRTELCKKVLKNKEMDFQNGVKNIQAAGQNGARTVDNQNCNCKSYKSICLLFFR